MAHSPSIETKRQKDKKTTRRQENKTTRQKDKQTYVQYYDIVSEVTHSPSIERKRLVKILWEKKKVKTRKYICLSFKMYLSKLPTMIVHIVKFKVGEVMKVMKGSRLC